MVKRRGIIYIETEGGDHLGMYEPQFSREGYAYIGEDEQWHIRNDAPEWAKKEFEEFMVMLNPVSNRDGLIVQV